jgi:hypothetical protein
MEPTPSLAPAIIAPAPDAPSFEVGGVTYTATDGLSVARLKIFQRLSMEFAVNTGLSAHIGALDSIWSNLNALKVADAIHTLGAIRDALAASVSRNRLKGPEICALFFNASDEDPSVYDHAKQTAKIAAWGAVHGGFFTYAAIRLASTSLGSYASLPVEDDNPPPGLTSLHE